MNATNHHTEPPCTITTLNGKLSLSRLKDVLNYDASTGFFMWKEGIRQGWKAGSLTKRGYVHIRVDGVSHQAHQLAWLYSYGSLPLNQIDHINHDKSDNRIINLRDVSQQENSRNLPLRRNSKSHVTGVCWNKTNKKWQAEIKNKGRTEFLGYFANIKDAKAVRKVAEKRIGFHANHGDQL